MVQCDQHGQGPGSYCIPCAGLAQAAQDRTRPAKRGHTHDSVFLRNGHAALGRKRVVPARVPLRQDATPGYGEEPAIVVDADRDFDVRAVDLEGLRG